MKMKLLLLKLFMIFVFCPIVGYFIKLCTSGHIKLGFLFLFSVIIAYVALEQLYIAIKRKIKGK